MSCAHYNELLNALLDGEIPAPEAAVLTAHLAGCADCTKTLAELAELRAGLAQLVPEETLSPDLQARIEAMLATPQIIPFRKRVNTGWVAAAALAAMLALALMPRHDETKDLMSVRDAALRTGGIETNTITAAPAVPGFQLASNRMDEVAGHVAEVAAYTKNGQRVTLCIWPANGEPAHGVKNAVYRGMAISYWNDGTHEYWAASTGPDLQTFVASLAPS